MGFFLGALTIRGSFLRGRGSLLVICLGRRCCHKPSAFRPEGYQLVNCVDTKLNNLNPDQNKSKIHRQCFFSDGIAIVSVITHNDNVETTVRQTTRGCMSQKVGLKGSKFLYVGGCVPTETIRYFFTNLSIN